MTEREVVVVGEAEEEQSLAPHGALKRDTVQPPMEPCPLLRRLNSGVAAADPPTQPLLRAACASLPRYRRELPEGSRRPERQARVKLSNQIPVVAYMLEGEPKVKDMGGGEKNGF